MSRTVRNKPVIGNVPTLGKNRQKGKGGGARKYDRNRTECAEYKRANRAVSNKHRRMIRALKLNPGDYVLAGKLKAMQDDNILTVPSEIWDDVALARMQAHWSA